MLKFHVCVNGRCDLASGFFHMPIPDPERWRGLRASARDALEKRDYGLKSLGAEEVAGNEDIPGVLVFPRVVYSQSNRGFFSELARVDDEPLAGLGLTAVTAVIARGSGGGARTPSVGMGHSAIGIGGGVGCHGGGG